MDHAPGTWYLAPSTDHADDYSAGYDGNSFVSQQEAEAAIPGLLACGEEFAATDWVAVQRVMPCECGEAMGQACGATLARGAVVIDWMPEWLRASHQAAGNSGIYPANGALRLRVTPQCAAHLRQHDGEWTTEARS